MDVDTLDTANDTLCRSLNAMEPEEMVEKIVKAGKELLLQVLYIIVTSISSQISS